MIIIDDGGVDGVGGYDGVMVVMNRDCIVLPGSGSQVTVRTQSSCPWMNSKASTDRSTHCLAVSANSRSSR